MNVPSAFTVPSRVQLIFNPLSGNVAEAPQKLLAVLTALQAQHVITQVHIVEKDSNLTLVIQKGLADGLRLFVVSGGDGTIDTVASVLAGSDATLLIVPTGTQNNLALSLGLPSTIEDAVGLIHHGHRTSIDVGVISNENTERTFIEACSVGLLSALFPAADDIQHGNLMRISDLLSTFVNSQPAEIRLKIDGEQVVHTQAHAVVITNMSYIGPHYQIDSESRYDDGLMELMVFSSQSKLDLVGAAVQAVGGGGEDPRLQRFRVHHVEIMTDPPMPVIVDGFPFGEGPLQVEVHQARLALLTAAQPVKVADPATVAVAGVLSTKVEPSHD
jgi:diacylglycerol kinase (ATP)